MKYISIDLETTGLNPETCQILEFGAVLEDSNNILPFDKIPKYHAFILHPGGNIFGNIFALNMNAAILEKIKNYKELESQYNFVKIEDLATDFLFWCHLNGLEIETKNEGETSEYKHLKSVVVAGKNFASFDKLFLNNVPKWNKLIRTKSRILDPAILFVDWEKDEAPPSLDDCKIRADIEGVVTHNAIDDALDVISLLRKHYQTN